MTVGPVLIEVHGLSHDRAGFSCGVEALDRYFRHQSMQDVRRRVTACYGALQVPGGRVAGYYTLAAASFPLEGLASALSKRLPRSPSFRWPGWDGGRDQAHRRRRLGSVLLWDAVQWHLRSEIAVFILVVDDKDDQTEAFYYHHGFVPFGRRQPRQLVLPLMSEKRGGG